MAAQRFKVLLEFDPESNAWVTYVPALDHISTHGETRDEVLENTRELILGYLEAAEKEGLSVPVGRPEFEIVDVEVTPA